MLSARAASPERCGVTSKGRASKTVTKSYVFGVFVETRLGELLELFRVGSGQFWRVVLWNEEEDPHRMQLRVGRFALGQFDGRDAQRPNVGLMSTKKNH